MDTSLDRSSFFPKVLQAVPADHFRLYAYFNDGSIRLFDAKPLIRPGTVFEPLSDPAVFASALTVLNDTVAWDLTGSRSSWDCIDLDPEAIFDLPPVPDPHSPADSSAG